MIVFRLKMMDFLFDGIEREGFDAINASKNKLDDVLKEVDCVKFLVRITG